MQQNPNLDIQAAINLAYQELESYDSIHRLDALLFIVQFGPKNAHSFQIFESKNHHMSYLGMLSAQNINKLLKSARAITFDTQKIIYRRTLFEDPVEIFPGPKLIVGRTSVPNPHEYTMLFIEAKKKFY